jgi:hypothetical protein
MEATPLPSIADQSVEALGGPRSIIVRSGATTSGS